MVETEPPGGEQMDTSSDSEVEILSHTFGNQSISSTLRRPKVEVESDDDDILCDGCYDSKGVPMASAPTFPLQPVKNEPAEVEGGSSEEAEADSGREHDRQHNMEIAPLQQTAPGLEVHSGQELSPIVAAAKAKRAANRKKHEERREQMGVEKNSINLSPHDRDMIRDPYRNPENGQKSTKRDKRRNTEKEDGEKGNGKKQKEHSHPSQTHQESQGVQVEGREELLMRGGEKVIAGERGDEGSSGAHHVVFQIPKKTQLVVENMNVFGEESMEGEPGQRGEQEGRTEGEQAAGDYSTPPCADHRNPGLIPVLISNRGEFRVPRVEDELMDGVEEDTLPPQPLFNLSTLDTNAKIELFNVGRLCKHNEKLQLHKVGEHMASAPLGCAFDPIFRRFLYTDTGGNTVVALSADGEFLMKWGGFIRPSAIAIQSAGSHFVVLDQNYITRIDQLMPQAKPHRLIKIEPRRFRGLAVLPDGNLATIFYQFPAEVVIFHGSKDNTLLYRCPLGAPHTALPSFICSTVKGTLYVSDLMTNRLCAFEYRKGVGMACIVNRDLSKHANGKKWHGFMAGVVADEEEKLLVVDAETRTLSLVSPTGTYIQTVKVASGEGGFPYGAGIAASSDGRLMICCRKANQVRLFDLRPDAESIPKEISDNVKLMRSFKKFSC